MSGVSKLVVDDEEFLVASIIDRCPKVMMLREIYQNAIDAAAIAEGDKVVRIGAVEVDGVRKLRIWNTGPGMDPGSLYAMCDLSSSIGKLKGLDRNFGIGAKVASLPSNHLGVRFRSCTQGRAFEVTLGNRDGVYGRIRRDADKGHDVSAIGRKVEVMDVSSQAVAAGEKLEFDWTEVVLLGMRPDQDTCENPYDGEPKVDKFWVPDSLFLRYFRTPDDVRTLIEPGLQWFGDIAEFRPLAGRLDAYARHEAVAAERGIKIHFIHDPAHPERSWENKSSDGAIHPTTALVALSWKGELYDVQRGSAWFYEAPRYGVTFGSRHLTVIVELPLNFDVLPEMYRQFLKYRSSTQANVRASDFARLVMANRPQWVRELAQQEREHEFDNEAQMLTFELTGLVRRAEFVPPKAARPLADDGEDAARPGSFARAVVDVCGIQPVLLFEAVDVRDRWLEGRAAVYYPETGQIFINMLYDSVDSFTTALRKACSIADLGFADEKTIARTAEFFYVRRILRALILALAKESKPLQWSPEHIQRAISPEALSTAAEDLDDLLELAIGAIRRQISS
ncbi:ATP-binding protein [uncultured Rhodoblastus sp.]|uniref:ATP-binding protein n=1 Tax=uncultured Rhodoblastus sp. TaxID=543037 RepID=UPI0025F6A5B7|nr:ATP-binding protein [uncultured Rhodoblastus sp.]